MVLEDKPSAQAWVIGYFESRVEAAAAWGRFVAECTLDLGRVPLGLRELPDEDWKNSYKVHFKASKFGRLNWVPVWEKGTFALVQGEEVLWLDPGMAFGTGNHETTRLCCERLVGFGARQGNQGRVIDAGCGSGILALSAAKLGFTDVVGFDNDAEAIRVSEENALLNNLGGRVRFLVGDLVTGLVGAKADLVLANIQSDVLIRFAGNLTDSVSPGGELVLCGILSRELEQVRSKFSALARWTTTESCAQGEWSDLRLVR